MTREQIFGSILLLIVAFVWGLGFVFQRSGMEHIGPYTFNAGRFVLGALSLLPVIWLFGRKTDPVDRGAMWTASILAGLCFFGGITLQQVGIVYTTAGKAAFITGLYIVIVPVFSIALGFVARWNVWVACLLALVGLFFLAETGSFRLAYGDTLILICAVFWALQIIVVGLYAQRLDGPTFAFGQTLTVTVIAVPLALIMEDHSWADLWAAKWALLFVGVIDTGFALTLQTLGQRRVPATPAGIILSLEAVFGALCGYLFLAEIITASMFFGGTLMLTAMILAQLTLPPLFRRADPKGSL
ncbi:MAG: DMT family transporter [Pseudomonadota bacterium]